MNRRPTPPGDVDELLEAFAEVSSRAVPPAAVNQPPRRPLFGALATGVAAVVLAALVGGLLMSRMLPQAAMPATPPPTPTGAVAVPTSLLEAQGVACYPSVLEGGRLEGSAEDPYVAWVVSSTGQRVNVLWPVGYSATFTPQLELHAPTGLLGRAGDEVTIFGGLNAAGEWDACGGVQAGTVDIGGEPLPWPTGSPPRTITPAPVAETPHPSTPPTPTPMTPSPSPVVVTPPPDEPGEWRLIPKAPIEGRGAHTAVWTGTEMIVWGGRGSADGAAYDPATNRWRRLPDAPIPGRGYHTAVWTGAEMIVWGGFLGYVDYEDGAAYDPATDAWRMLSASPLSRANGHTEAVWTGTEVIICGSGCAAYDPLAERWRELPTPPQSGPIDTIIWTGEALLAFRYPNVGPVTGASYDPLTDAWRDIAKSSMSGLMAGNIVWTGSEVLFLSHFPRTRSMGLLQTNAAYDPAADTWRYLATHAPGGVFVPVWNGSEVLLANGRAYHPPSDSWRTLASPPDHKRLEGYTSVWTGTEVLVWGGGDFDGGTLRADGVAFRPGPGSGPPDEP